MTARSRRIHTPALALLLVLSACGREEPRRTNAGPQRPGTIEIGGEAAEDHGMYSVTSSEPVTVTAGEFYFEPTLLAGSPGLEIEVSLAPGVETPHTFTLPEQEIDQEIAPSGSPVAFVVTFPNSGTITFFCRFHRDRGMLGGLVAA